MKQTNRARRELSNATFAKENGAGITTIGSETDQDEGVGGMNE